MTVNAGLTLTGNATNLTTSVLEHRRKHGSSSTVATVVDNSVGNLCLTSHSTLSRYHHVHTKDSLMALFVTENRQLYHACVPHGDNPDPTTMQYILIKSNINKNAFIYIEPVFIENGGLFAVHTGWIDSIIDHESSDRFIVLWQGGDSFLQSGGSASDLLKHNSWYREYITNKEVFIDGCVVDRLRHEFILMPLAYTMQSEETSLHKLKRSKAWDIVPGQVYAKFEVYKTLAMIENEKNYPDQLAGLPDPSLLAVMQQTSTGVTQRCNTDVWTARSNKLGSETLLTDRQNMLFMVELQKWLRDNYRQQTNEVLASSPPTGLQPAKKQKLTKHH